MLCVGVIASHPGRTAGAALEGTAVEAELSSLGLISANLAVDRLLLIVIVTDNLDRLLVSRISDKLFAVSDLLHIDRLAVVGTLAKGQEGKVEVDIVILVPVGMDICSFDGVSPLRSGTVMVPRSETKSLSIATDTVTSSEDNVPAPAFNDTGGTKVFLDVASVEDADRWDAVKGSGTTTAALRRDVARRACLHVAFPRNFQDLDRTFLVM
jgi:hypothetical protein